MSVTEAQAAATQRDEVDPLERLLKLRVLALAVVESEAAAQPLGAALIRGGLPCVEVGMRTPASERVLAQLAVEPGLLVGAGTVLRADQAERVVAAGARFVVTPGFSPTVAEACRSLGVPLIPGVATASEIMQALDAGYDVLKFFPAEQSGGLPALAALNAAFPGVRFIPTGGISLENMNHYLDHAAVAAVGGSWITSSELLARGDFAGVEIRARQAVAHARRLADGAGGGS